MADVSECWRGWSRCSIADPHIRRSCTIRTRVPVARLQPTPIAALGPAALCQSQPQPQTGALNLSPNLRTGAAMRLQKVCLDAAQANLTVLRPVTDNVRRVSISHPAVGRAAGHVRWWGDHHSISSSFD